MKQETLNLQNAVNDGENFTNQVTIPEVKTSPDATASDTSATVSDSADAETETEELKTTKGKVKFKRSNFTNTSLYSFNPNYPNLQINIGAFLDDKMTLKDRGMLITIIAACVKNVSVYFDDTLKNYGLGIGSETFARYIESLIAKGYLMRKKAKDVLNPEEYKIKGCNGNSKVYFLRTDKPEYVPRESEF